MTAINEQHKKEKTEGEGATQPGNVSSSEKNESLSDVAQPGPDLPDDSLPNRNIGKREWDEKDDTEDTDPGSAY